MVIVNEKGFKVIRKHFPAEDLKKLENAIIDLYRMQSNKTGYRTNDGMPLGEIIEQMEENDKEALYQVQHLLPQSPAIRAVIDPLTCFLPDSLISGPGLFISRPHSNRLLYKWHSEEHYYPKRRTFINAWFPLFGDKTQSNGAMSVKVGSHKQTYPFSEYQSGPHHFMQYEIPDVFVKHLPEYHCECKRGDLVLFDKNLVHRSNENQCFSYSFAMVVRIWNPKDDLTLAGDFCATPYGKDIGRERLCVSP